MSQQTFSITTSGNDGWARGIDTFYPPIGDSFNTAGAQLYATKEFATPNYVLIVALLRFDTSALPDDATILSATLSLDVSFRPSANARDITAEWYEAGTIGTEDYTSTVGTDAHAGTLISSLAIGINNLALTNVSNVSLTGITGLRLHVSGGTPTGDNTVEISSFDHATAQEPRLTVNYDEFQGSATAAWLTA